MSSNPKTDKVDELPELSDHNMANCAIRENLKKWIEQNLKILIEGPALLESQKSMVVARITHRTHKVPPTKLETFPAGAIATYTPPLQPDAPLFQYIGELQENFLRDSDLEYGEVAMVKI